MVAARLSAPTWVWVVEVRSWIVNLVSDIGVSLDKATISSLEFVGDMDIIRRGGGPALLGPRLTLCWSVLGRLVEDVVEGVWLVQDGLPLAPEDPLVWRRRRRSQAD